MEVEQATFTPLVFTTTGGMAEECRRYHSRLAKLLAEKKGKVHHNLSWIRTKVSFAILRSALLSLRGSRATRRISTNLQNTDFAVFVVPLTVFVIPLKLFITECLFLNNYFKTYF